MKKRRRENESETRRNLKAKQRDARAKCKYEERDERRGGRDQCEEWETKTKEKKETREVSAANARQKKRVWQRTYENTRVATEKRRVGVEVVDGDGQMRTKAGGGVTIDTRTIA